jgi:hypothetical protein
LIAPRAIKNKFSVGGNVSNSGQPDTELGREKSLASFTDQTPRKRSRYLGHDTGECDASFPLCHLQLNSFKVTETVLQV